MPTIQSILVYSHVMALPTWLKMIQRGLFWESILWGCCITASCFMHWSETKHGLQAPSAFWKKWSSLFLNLDRLGSYATALGLYYSQVHIHKQNITRSQLFFGIFGMICLVAGELAGKYRYLRAYLILHLLWHFCVFTLPCFYLLLHLFCAFLDSLDVGKREWQRRNSHNFFFSKSI